jgi:hypothetical protein
VYDIKKFLVYSRKLVLFGFLRVYKYDIQENLNQAFSGIEYSRGKIALLAGIFPARNIPENT